MLQLFKINGEKGEEFEKLEEEYNILDTKHNAHIEKYG